MGVGFIEARGRNQLKFCAAFFKESGFLLV
jgi:hypothetical protein